MADRQRLDEPGSAGGNGSSAGGAVVSAALVQRPELLGAVVLDYPVLDMLRYDRFTGARRWRAEYGTTENPAEFRALLAYSPVHNVAAHQAAQPCDRPILLRVSWGAGHSSGATLEDSIDTWADQLAFLLRVLGSGI